MKDNLRILIAAGGTAGHINPAIAIAGYIKHHSGDVKISFVGRSDGMECSLVKQAGFDFISMKVYGFQRSLSFNGFKRNIYAVWCLLRSFATAKKILADFKPDIVIGTGGYICGPIMKMAQSQKIKTAIHESNAFPGVTNKLLAKNCDLVFAVSEEATERLRVPYKTIVSGNPVRQEIYMQNRLENRSAIGAGDKQTVILSFGGSLGSHKINEAVAGFCSRVTQHSDDYLIIHATGRYDKGFFKEKSTEFGFAENKNIRVKEYINDMPVMLSAADLVIARSGAITVSEIEASGCASVLIPSPNVAENHQYYNALGLEKAGAAIIILDKDLTSEKLYETIVDLTQDTSRLREMGIAAKTCCVHDALPKIYLHIEKLMGR